MKNKTQKNFNSSHKNCIFCGTFGALTGEHMYANWLTEILPLEWVNHTHTTTSLPNVISYAPGANVIKNKRRISGDPGTRKLRHVCGKCNSQWMSDLQNKAKPLLTEAILGRWANFGENALLIAEWCVMTAMVHEYDNPPAVTFTSEERKAFQQQRKIPDSIVIWIGLAPKEVPARRKMHRAYRNLDAPDEKMQAFSLHIGDLLIQLVTLGEVDSATIKAKAWQWGMRLLWPIGDAQLASTKPECLKEYILEQSQHRLTHFFEEYMRGMRMDLMYPHDIINTDPQNTAELAQAFLKRKGINTEEIQEVGFVLRP